MIAEVQGGQEAVQIINALRATHPTLPRFASTDPNVIRETVREERRRELWLQGTRIGDKLRWDQPWVSGLNARGEVYNASATCVPLHELEYQTNSTLRHSGIDVFFRGRQRIVQPDKVQ